MQLSELQDGARKDNQFQEIIPRWTENRSTKRMPEQVWQTEDGTIFKTEIEAIRYEESDRLFRNFYDENGKRKEQIPDISRLGSDFGSSISPRLMQMFLKEFGSLQNAIPEIKGFSELKNRQHDLR